MKHKLLLSLALLTAPVLANSEPVDEPVNIVYEAGDSYEFVVENVKNAIINRGLLVSEVLHIADMLDRTGEDLGFTETVYLQAESIEFCSAQMTYRMTLADPGNIAICPFNVAVYVLADQPEQVYVAFRRPQLAGDDAEIAAEAFELVDGIAREASEW